MQKSEILKHIRSATPVAVYTIGFGLHSHGYQLQYSKEAVILGEGQREVWYSSGWRKHKVPGWEVRFTDGSTRVVPSRNIIRPWDVHVQLVKQRDEAIARREKEAAELAVKMDEVKDRLIALGFKQCKVHPNLTISFAPGESLDMLKRLETHAAL